jgi:hypothetical protein
MSGSSSYLTERKWGRMAEGMRDAGTEGTGQLCQSNIGEKSGTRLSGRAGRRKRY